MIVFNWLSIAYHVRSSLLRVMGAFQEGQPENLRTNLGLNHLRMFVWSSDYIYWNVDVNTDCVHSPALEGWNQLEQVSE
jgi:hypothetical protein